MELTIKQAAEYLSISIDTLRRWEKAGRITPKRVGSRNDRKYSVKELDNILAETKHIIQIPTTKIRSLCSAYQTAVTKFLKELVETPSINGGNDEKNVADLILYKAQQLELPSFLIWKDKKRPNVFVGNSFTEQESFLFVAHLDTVPTGALEKWTSPPFKPTIMGGKMYGRGTADCKAGIALSLYSLKILKELGYLELAKFVGGSDEEAGAQSDIGLPYVIKKGLRAAAAIYTYPGYSTISLGHRGLIRQIVTCHGEQIHTGLSEWSNKTKGKNAIEGLIAFANEIGRIPLNEVHEKFGTLKSTQTITMFNGGIGESIVPDKATLLLDTRLLPSLNHEQYIERIAKIATSLEKQYGYRYEITVKNNGKASLISEKEPIVKILSALAQEVFAVKPQLRGRGPFNESGLLNNQGIPTVGGFGVRGENVHGIDEYVELEDIPKVLETYVRAAIELHNWQCKKKRKSVL